MEKRSHRRIRDLDVLTAFQGLVANEIGCARISMMAREQETPLDRAEYRRARPIISRSSHLACTARPVHTKYMVRRRRPPSAQGWRTFLRNHADGIAAMDLFLVPTISFRAALWIADHGTAGRRELLWVGVTAHPTAELIARQLVEAYGWQRGAPLHDLRPGWSSMARAVHQTTAIDGYSGPSRSQSFPMAKRTCRTAHRIHPQGLP